MPFHFQDGNSNWLTNAALDPTAKVPEYKVCAVKVEAILANRGLFAARDVGGLQYAQAAL